MSKYYTLIVDYLSGSCAFATDKTDLVEALNEFDEVRRAEFAEAVGDKTFALPDIISARLVKTYYRK